MRKTEIVKKIEKFIKKHDLHHDVRIYFNDKAWCYNSRGQKTVEKEVSATDYLEYGNNDTISMSFEGGLYNVLNFYWENKHYEKLWNEFTAIFDEYDCFYELGNAWNLSVYE